ncbi:MAG: bifunctional methylenetetrahydrofolate dehydrogenase/methenyltetrahydrofolate cyclohydrolase [Methanospirillaceae archaeon]|nr:bifunctional methylenetetrahydrofolate dehydrogenase/methenyltetrahydrofolate cyclohydrolase [Methanospirillaceae archaeon]
MILDGRALSQQRLEILKEKIQEAGISPHLATIIVGSDPGSRMYVRMKHKACEQVGIHSIGLELLESSLTDELIRRVRMLNEDPDIDGILIQLPLPVHIDSHQVLEAVSPAKDVDGFHTHNIGSLVAGMPGLTPCTPTGIMTILSDYHIPVAGAHAVVIGRSIDVGKPMASLLINADATVTVCHSKTSDLSYYTRHADIVISAAGRPKLITAGMIRPGATVIDVGINHVDGVLCGDVDFESVLEVAGAITPVPGGVGPMTIATLMENTYRAAMDACRPAQ